MKQYLLSVYHPEDYSPAPEAQEKIMQDVDAVVAASGHRIAHD